MAPRLINMSKEHAALQGRLPRGTTDILAGGCSNSYSLECGGMGRQGILQGREGLVWYHSDPDRPTGSLEAQRGAHTGLPACTDSKCGQMDTPSPRNTQQPPAGGGRCCCSATSTGLAWLMLGCGLGRQARALQSCLSSEWDWGQGRAEQSPAPTQHSALCLLFNTHKRANVTKTVYCIKL